MLLGEQYQQIAASDIPLQCMSDYVEDFVQQESNNENHHDQDDKNTNTAIRAKVNCTGRGQIRPMLDELKNRPMLDRVSPIGLN